MLPEPEQVGVAHDADRRAARVEDRRVVEAPVEHEQEHLAGHRILRAALAGKVMTSPTGVSRLRRATTHG